MLVLYQYFTCEQKYIMCLYELHMLWKDAAENTDTLRPFFYEVRMKSCRNGVWNNLGENSGRVDKFMK